MRMGECHLLLTATLKQDASPRVILYPFKVHSNTPREREYWATAIRLTCPCSGSSTTVPLQQNSAEHGRGGSSI